MSTFVSCDWGTTNFRLKLIDSSSLETLAWISSEDGISKIHQRFEAQGGERYLFFRDVLQRQMAALEQRYGKELDAERIIISGMASSKIGMLELPYASIPLSVAPAALPYKILQADRQFPYEIVLVSGLSSTDDVMRGEETILSGCAGSIGDALYILPGTHSKHIWIKDGQVIRFNTYITGELFELLASNSIIKNSVLPVELLADAPGFEEGLKRSKSGNLLNTIFQLRAGHVLHGTDISWNRQLLSGLLIGAELKELASSSDSAICLLSTGALMQRYRVALQLLLPGVSLECLEASDALIRAHAALHISI